MELLGLLSSLHSPSHLTKSVFLFLLYIVAMQHNSKQLGVMLDGKEFVAIALTVIKTMWLMLFLD